MDIPAPRQPLRGLVTCARTTSNSMVIRSDPLREKPPLPRSVVCGKGKRREKRVASICRDTALWYFGIARTLTCHSLSIHKKQLSSTLVHTGGWAGVVTNGSCVLEQGFDSAQKIPTMSKSCRFSRRACVPPFLFSLRGEAGRSHSRFKLCVSGWLGDLRFCGACSVHVFWCLLRCFSCLVYDLFLLSRHCVLAVLRSRLLWCWHYALTRDGYEGGNQTSQVRREFDVVTPVLFQRPCDSSVVLRRRGRDSVALLGLFRRGSNSSEQHSLQDSFAVCPSSAQLQH